MPDKNSSCPRCGFQDMRDISFWKNENHICAECGAYWKTISDERSGVSMDNTFSSDEFKSSSMFGKRKQKKSDETVRQNVIMDHKPSAVTEDFFDNVGIASGEARKDSKNNSDNGYRFNVAARKSYSKKRFIPELSFVNGATFAVVAVTLVSLPQIGLFSTAGQAIQEQVAYYRGDQVDLENAPLVDPIVTASISKKSDIVREFRVGEVRFTRIAKGTQSHIVVHGMIRNVSGKDSRTKPIRIIMLDKDGNEVQSWVYMVRDKILEPGKIMRFRSTVKAEGFKAKSVDVVVLN